MVPSLDTVSPQHRHCYQVSSGSKSSSEITSPDPSSSTSSASSLSSSSNTNSFCASPSHAPQQRDTFAVAHHAQVPAASYRPQNTPHPSASLPTDTAKHQHTTSEDSQLASGSRFDSLHDLLERAGYKETRVVTPDRQTLAGMFANKLATPPRKPRLVDDFSSDSPSLAASELRRAMQRSSAGRSTPPTSAVKSKSLPSRNYKLPATADSSVVPPLPSGPGPASSFSWFSNIWLFGPGTIISDPPAAGVTESHETDSPQSPLRQSQASTDVSTSSALATTATSTSASASTSALALATSAQTSPLKSKRTASNNPVWSASVAYRSNKSRTAPVRKSTGIASSSFDLKSSDAAAEEEWKALQKGISNGASRRRTGLIDAFTSPTKKPPSSNPCTSQDSPSRQRRWRQERAAWRESLGDLQAMMDQSRMRRGVAAATAAARAEAAPVKTSTTDESAESNLAEAPSTSPHCTSKQSDADAVAKLLSSPALPFLSTDPAVAPRNGSCTRPTHLSMRRMKSVEVLSKIMRERSTITSRTSATPAETQASVELDTEAGQISPTIKKRSTPPRLTVSSPRGISSPKELALEGQEFEPFSWSPGKHGGALIISNRRLQKKPRSKLRHVSSGSDLRSAAATDELKTPKGRGRSRSRGSLRTSPSKTCAETTPDQIEALLHQSVGSLSHRTKVQALQSNVHVYDNTESEREEHASGVNDSPTLRRSKSSTCTPLVLTNGQEVEDVFRSGRARASGGGGVLKKKDFHAKITRTSKIMRLIEEAENIPSIASLMSQTQAQSQDSCQRRMPLGNIEAAPQSIAVQPLERIGDRPEEKEARLSSSLSRKSRERMHTITRVLGQRHATNQT